MEKTRLRDNDLGGLVANSLLRRKLAIGTAQFGMDYGVANSRGRNSYTECERILTVAREAGADTLDTAIAYGESESRLGEIGVATWRVVSKLPPIPNRLRGVRDWVQRCLSDSLRRLNLTQIHGLLLHRPLDLIGELGSELCEALHELVQQRVVAKVGLSIYDPSELDAIAARGLLGGMDLVQVPFNVFDRRIDSSGWLGRLHARNVEIHSRSTFLQGLLLMRLEQQLIKFSRWQTHWVSWDSWLMDFELSALQACLAVPFLTPEIGRVVVGVDGSQHLCEILDALNGRLIKPPFSLACDDRELISPSQWNLT